MPPQIKTLTAELYEPTNSATGNNPPTVFRGQNFVLRGGAGTGKPYFEVFGGNKDLNENFDLVSIGAAITGTLSFNANSNIVNGAGGAVFTDQLHVGQKLLAANGEVLCVKQIIKDDQFLSDRPAKSTAAGQTAYRLMQMWEMDGKRAVAFSGSAIEFEKGHIVGVGSGDLYINGAPLAGASLTLTKNAQVAIYQPSTADYLVLPLGFEAAPPLPTINVITGGTKGMTDGNKYSFMVAYWAGTPEGSNGYSNPSDVIKLDSASAPIKINGANNLFEFNFTDSLVDLPSNAKGFIIFASQGGKKSLSVTGGTTTTTSPNETNYENGPWFVAKKVLISALDGANKTTLEFLDADLGAEVTGDNYPPPSAEFVMMVEGKPMYCSCNGKAKTGDENGAAPGKYCFVSKYGNPDGVPPDWRAKVEGDIIGGFFGVGRYFMMTPSTLDFIVSTGLLGQASTALRDLELPIISRPYWKTGASNRYSITIVDDTLYGFSGRKLLKSVGNGDENVEKYNFGAKVEDITRRWNGGYVYTVADANNILFIHTAAYKNDAGFWVTEILPYSLFYNAFLPLVVLSDAQRDQIISGVACVNERVEFLCGGRVTGGDFEMKTYRYDDGDGSDAGNFPAYLVWQISDDGFEDKSKYLKSIRPSGKFTNLSVKIYGQRPGGELIVEDLEDGTNALATIAFDASTEITRYRRKKFKVKNLANYAIRIATTWDGSGMLDRLDELALEIGLHGKKR